MRPAPLALISLSMWRTADQAATAVQTAAAEQRHVGAVIEKEDRDDGHGTQHHHYDRIQGGRKGGWRKSAGIPARPVCRWGGEERVDDMRPDEPGAAGDQRAHQ